MTALDLDRWLALKNKKTKGAIYEWGSDISKAGLDARRLVIYPSGQRLEGNGESKSIL